jgi:hypothetical protein
MNHDLNLSVLKKLTPAYADSGDWILERMEVIGNKRLKERERAAFNKGVDKALSPFTVAFWESAFQGMGRIIGSISVGHPTHTKPTKSSHQQNLSLSQSFEWSFDNLRLAIAEYITEKNVPLDIFTADEQVHLFGQTAPSFADDYKPQADI